MNEEELNQMGGQEETISGTPVPEEESLETLKAVTPIGKFNCQSYPLIEGNIYYISSEEIEKLGRHELKWATEHYEEEEEGEIITKTRPILIPNDPTDENNINAAINRIAELKKLLFETDYEAIKFAEGEMSAEDYAPFKERRASWRAEINSLQELYKL